jgi:tetratricopeptide (TPR) repeat protein
MTMQQARSAVRLTPAERRQLRRVMARESKLDALKDMAFDLGTEFTVFHQESVRTFCRELVAWHERTARTSCLVAAVLERTPDKDSVLEDLLTRVSACTPRILMQVAIGRGKKRDADAQLGALAEKLGVTTEEIILVTAVRRSERLLVSIPAGTVGIRAISAAGGVAADPSAGKTLVPFESLDALDRHAWRWVARTWPPVIVEGKLQPVASWEEALDAVRAELTNDVIQAIEDGRASAQMGDHVRAVAFLEKGVQIAQELGDAEMEAAVLGHQGNVHYDRGQTDQAIDLYRQALTVAREIARETGDRRTEGIYLGNLGVAYYAQGQTQAAIAYHQRALAIARQAGDLRTEGSLLGHLGLAYSALTQTAQSPAAVHSTAVDYYQQALAIVREVSQEIDDRRTEGTLLGHLGDAYRGMGQAPGAGGAPLRRANLYAAADTYHRALVIAREVGDLRSEGDLLGRLGNTYFSLGDLGDRYYGTAIDQFQQALTIAREIGDRQAEGTRLGNLGSTLYALGQVEHALDIYRQALDIAREIGDRRGEGMRLGNLGNAHYALALTHRRSEACDQDAPSDAADQVTHREKLLAAIDAYRQALAIAREVGDRRAEGVHLGHLGLVYYALCELDSAFAIAEVPSQVVGTHSEELSGHRECCQAAIEAYEQALAIAREIGDRKAEGVNLGRLGDAYSVLGQVPGARPRDRRPAAARECYRQALAIAREVGDRRAEAHHLGHLGSVYSDLGEREQAIASLEQALIMSREIGDRLAEASHLGDLGLAYSAFGQDARARTYFQQAVSVAHDLGDRRCEGNWLGDLGSTYSATGQYEQAVRCYSRALEIARDLGDQQNEATWLANLGNAYVALREAQQGIEVYQEALALARQVQDRSKEEGLLGNLGNAYSLQRSWDKAVSAYGEALVVAREIGDRRGEGIWLLDLGLALSEQGDREGAIAQVKAARDVLEAAGSPEAAQAADMLEQWAKET